MPRMYWWNICQVRAALNLQTSLTKFSREDMRKLDDGQHIVVGTPGRVFDMISRKILRPNYIKQFVLDEADEMLSRGFKDQIYDVFRHLNQETQVL